MTEYARGFEIGSSVKSAKAKSEQHELLTQPPPQQQQQQQRRSQNGNKRRHTFFLFFFFAWLLLFLFSLEFQDRSKSASNKQQPACEESSSERQPTASRLERETKRKGSPIKMKLSRAYIRRMQSEIVDEYARLNALQVLNSLRQVQQELNVRVKRFTLLEENEGGGGGGGAH